MTFVHGLLVLVLVLGWAAFATSQVRRGRRVWQGEHLDFLPLRTMRGPEVNDRNYPLFAAISVLFSGAAVLMVVGDVVGRTWQPQGGAAARAVVVLVGALALCLVPVLSVITAFNRPRRLVPPSLRGEAGSRASARDARERRRAGLPETDHEVEILDVRPAPDDPKPYPPYFVAVCAAPGCGWVSDVVDQAEGDGSERAVRELAARHSSHVVGPRRPVG